MMQKQNVTRTVLEGPLPDEQLEKSTDAPPQEAEKSTNTHPQNIVGDGDLPTEDDLKTLRRIHDKIPLAIFLVAMAEVAERFAYRCLTGPMQNYIQNPFHDSLRPGALGLGQATATAIGYFFQFWCYLTPILGAVAADSWLGRFKTILFGAMIATVGIAILFVTSLPISLEHNAGLPGLIISLLIVGLGTGGIKSNVGPLIAEQYSDSKPTIKTLKTGERVILDPDVTIQTIFSRYYWFINVGASSGLIATWVEVKVGFWAAYLISLCVYTFTVMVLITGRKKYITRPPQGSIIPQAFHAFWIGLKSGFDMDKAKPSYMIQEHGHSDVSWDDHFIDELKIALIACRVFPVFWTCYGQTSGNLVSQAARMNTYGLPNDFFGSINPITVLLLIPLLDNWIYPALRHHKIEFKPIARITVGFFTMSAGIAFAAGSQYCMGSW
ncbi:POT family protein [Phlyctema vagabunda]|uniref:POT family protein n=1 Tax=Phlyctema vagabunda TaxID=108571 RepID=A0ABR4P8A3_9HELO